MQSGYRARGNLGYYGEEFFDFGPFEEIRGEVLELGRACVHRDYRNTNVLQMLWKGIARYALSCGAPLLRTNPVESRKCKSSGTLAALPGPPRLFRAYLDISARICGPPAIDREFKTIDFLTLVDLQALPDRVRTRVF